MSTKFFDDLWNDFTQLNPSAIAIEKNFQKEYGHVFNDHVAFRTFDFPEIGLDKFISFFKNYGYVVKGEYHFKEKKLFAKHLEHEDEGLPKIFVSELLTSELSKQAQKLIKQTVNNSLQDQFHPIMGKSWDFSHKDYMELKKESEYAAWLLAFGIRVNHFTILVNKLGENPELEDINKFLKNKLSLKLNESGGEIKGTKEIGLRQSSTLAHSLNWKFSDGEFHVPSCYYEFAKRYVVNGKLFSGFVTDSADKIFESTNKSQ